MRNGNAQVTLGRIHGVSFGVVIWKGSGKSGNNIQQLCRSLCGVITTIFGKRSDRPGIRNIHTRTANRAIHPARMLHYRRNSPELTETLGALDVDNIDQLKTLLD